MTPTRINHRQQGYDRLLDIFKDKPNIVGLINIYLKQKDSIENAIFQLLNSRHLSDLDTVVGKQLDIIGELVGQERLEDTDEEYRKYILLRIGVNNSQATQGYITNLLKDTTESTGVKYFPHYPASYIAEFNGDYIPRNFLTELQNATVAGVNAGFIHNKDDLGLICCEVGSTDPIADRSILPEYTALTGASSSEIYMDNVNPIGGVPTPVKGSKLKQAFAITQHTGNYSTTLNVDVGLDLTSSESMLLWWNTQSGGYMYNYSPLFIPSSGNGLLKQWYGGTSISSIDLSFTTTGFTEPFTAPTTRINQTGTENYVHSLKSTPEVLEIFEYTGDGTLSQTINHSLGKTPLYMSIQRKGVPFYVNHWYKDMGIDKIFGDRFSYTIGAALGGTLPTSSTITVGDIGGNYSANIDGVEYVVLLLADNPDEGITGGSYISTGVAGQEVIIGNEVGLLSINGFTVSGDVPPVYYSKVTGTDGKLAYNLNIPSGTLQNININSDTIVLGSDNTYTNSSSLQKYYWFNIADPNSTIN